MHELSDPMSKASVSIHNALLQETNPGNYWYVDFGLKNGEHISTDYLPQEQAEEIYADTESALYNRSDFVNITTEYIETEDEDTDQDEDEDVEENVI
jgi:hypothetical protein